MAKKVRKRPEDDEAHKFEFPPFDEKKFLVHEYEQTIATLTAGALAVLIGLVSWVLTVKGLPWFAPAVVGVAVLVLTIPLLQRIRPLYTVYTKGDWAGVIAIEFFGWLGLWFVLLNIVGSAL